MTACNNVCLSVCPVAYISQATCQTSRNCLYTRYYWSWLGRLLTTMQYVMYVLPVLWMTSRVHIMTHIFPTYFPQDAA